MIAREESVTDAGKCEWCDRPAKFRYEMWRWVNRAGRHHKAGIARFLYVRPTHRQNAAAATLEPAPKKQ